MSHTEEELALSPRQPLNRRRVRRISGFGQTKSNRDRVLRVATVNIGTMAGRSREVVEMLARRRVDICAVQEVRYKAQGVRIYGSGNERYKFWWSGGEERERGVGLLVREEWVENVIEVVRWNDRMMKIKMVGGKKVMHIFSVYAPQQGRANIEKEEFREKLTDKIQEVPDRDVVLIAGDLNGHIGTDRTGYENVMGEFGYGVRNEEGEEILRLCQENNLKIYSTWFKKRDEHLVTYSSGGNKTQVDFIMGSPDGIDPKDCKVIPGEACITQHRLLCMDMKMTNLKAPKGRRREKKIKVWKLKDPEVKQRFLQMLRERLGEEDSREWEVTSDIFMKVAKEVCGEATGHRQKERETWWWSEEIRQVLKEKKEAYKTWQREGTEFSRERYREICRRAKREVSRAKDTAWREWSKEINTVEGKQRMFKIAKQMRKERKDVTGGKYIKDEDNNILIEEQDIRERWKQYFASLLNEENPHNIEELPPTEGPLEEISEEEIRRALGNMKRGKATGPSGLSSDILREAGDIGVAELLKVCRKLETENVPVSWKDSTTVAIYKGKGDALECGKHRGIRLLEHPMKIWEKVMENRLRKLVVIDEIQFAYQEGRSTMDAIFIVRQVQEKYTKKKKRVYHIFVDLEKAFDRIPREAIRWALRRQMVPERLVNQVMALYVGTTSRVRTGAGMTEKFEIGVGVHQGSALSPLLFILIMQEATRNLRNGEVMELLYADDLVIMAEERDDVVERFNRWKENLEERGMKINMEKTKVMITGEAPAKREEVGRFPCGCCGKGVGNNSIYCTLCRKWCHKRCSGLRDLRRAGNNFICPACVRGPLEAREREVEVEGEKLKVVDSFSYLGDKLSCESGAEAATKHRVAVAWAKWREIGSLLVNKSIPLGSRANVYEACVRSVMLYGAETWPTTREIERRVRSADCRMLRYMAGVRWEDYVSNEEVVRRCGLEDVVSVMRRRRLRWYGHVERRDEEHILRRAMEMEVAGRRPRGRPRKTWRETIEEDMRGLGLRRRDVYDRGKWRGLIARPTPT